MRALLGLNNLILPLAAAATELPEGTMISMDASTIPMIVIQLFNVAVLTLVLVWLLYRPVRQFLADRTQRIQDEIDEARRIHEEAMELKERYEKQLEGIEAEREEILRNTHKQAVERSDQMLFDARREADLMYQRAMDDLEVERKNLADEMKEQMIEISYLMASRFVQVSIDRKTQDEYIAHALADWEGGATDA